MHPYPLATIVALLAIPTASGAATSAQDYPTRPVRIVTATPGGGNDFLARMIAPGLTAIFGQQVIVDNRVSRFVGGIGARATPDGYTLVVGGAQLQFLPMLEKMDYDLLRDFAPVSQLERSPNILLVQPSLKVNSVAELIAMAKARPGSLTYGTALPGGSLFLAAELFKLATGVDIRPIPYKSTGPALLGLLTGEVQLVFSPSGAASIHVRDGRLKALAVTTAQATPLAPGVPTLASQGLPGFEFDTIGFMVVPAKTPPNLVRRLNQHVVQLMHQGDIKERMAGSGSELITGTPAELVAKLRADDVKMRKVYKQLGITVH